MSRPSSSTAVVEARPSRRTSLIGSTEVGSTAPTVAVVPLSARTPRTLVHSGDVLFASPESFQTALADYLADIDATAGAVACGYTEPGGLLIFESPTLRLTAEPFQQIGLFCMPRGWAMAGWSVNLGNLSFSAVKAAYTIAAPVLPLHSLLSSTDYELSALKFAKTKLGEAVAAAKEEWFEDGVESEFARTLSTLVHAYGDATVAAVETFLSSPGVNIEIAVEAVQSLGEADHPASLLYRRTLLEKLVLNSSAVRLRHGAAAGLAAMNDPSSIPTLIEARNREPNRRLQHFLELVVAQLERTRACGS